MKYRILFLDFDGPIFSLRSHLAYHGRGGVYYDVDPVSVIALERVCKTATDIRIVLTAGERFNQVTMFRALCSVTDHSLLHYLHPDSKVAKNVHVSGMNDRSASIYQWLVDHPRVDDYRIVDDDMWDYPPEHRLKWAKCTTHDGMPATTILKLLRWAAGESEE